MLDLDQLIQDVRKVEETMSPEQRQDLWFSLMEGYCMCCGDKDPEDNCQCENDE